MTTIPTSTPSLIRQLERLPANPSAAVRVLWLADDPSSSSEDLAAAINSDPALTTRIMHMANSAYYGLSGRVQSSAFAITVLGFSSVRTLAAAAAAGALDHGDAVPPGFWSHAAATAAGAALLADRVGARRTEAFSLGLLHDLGRALLHRVDAAGYAAVQGAAAAGASLLQAERAGFGTDHAEAVTRVLEAWRFPDEFVAAIARHHNDPAEAQDPLARALMAGEAIAGLAVPEGADNGDSEHGDSEHSESEHGDSEADGDSALSEDTLAALAVAGVELSEVDSLVAQVVREADGLAASFRS